VHALTRWAPHIVYVEGGNTFWLQHCLEKGNWAPRIKAACTGPDATAIYIGKSAGMIIAGATVETATWKVRTYVPH
jgi:peptidase E